MPRSCPHCGTTLPAVVDAYCPECREDLSATPEEVAAKPTLGEMAEVMGKPLAAVGGLALGFLEIALAVTSLATLFAALVAREWELAGGAAFFFTLRCCWSW